MADEDRVGVELLEMLRRIAPEGAAERLVVRWVDDGLPAQPVDGDAGREQLRHGLAMLRQLIVDVDALVALADLHPDGFAFERSDPDDSSGRLAEERQATRAWLEDARATVERFEAFIRG